MEIQEVFEQIGLSKSEIEIYLRLLKLGESKVNKIKENLNFPRSTIYATLDSLIQKGYVCYVIKSGVKYFEAVNPKRILLNLQEKEKNFQEILSQLEKIYRVSSEKPFVEIYEGKEGLKTIFETVKKDNPSEEFVISNTEIFKLLEFYFPHYMEEKRKLGIKTKAIGPKSKDVEKYLKELKEKIRGQEIRFLPESFALDSRIQIYNDKTIIINEEKESLMSISIKDKKVASTMKKIFDNLWKQGESYS